MKKLTLLVLIGIISVFLIIANVSAFDPCIAVNNQLLQSGFYTAAKAYMYPGPDTYPHAHQAVARLYDYDFVLLRTAYSAYDEGWVTAVTSYAYDPAFTNFSWGYFYCPNF